MVEISEEQVAELQDKIKNMSPEEIKEFQKKNCIFCNIADGKIASRKIYEDDKCIAVLDINPANPGHVLLMPKEHYPIMPMAPEDELNHLFMAAKALSHAALKALKAEGTTIFIANGVSAGQRAQHFMVHIIPRKEKDGLTSLDISQKKFSSAQISAVKKEIIGQIARVFKLKKGVAEIEGEEKELKKEAGEEAKENKKSSTKKAEKISKPKKEIKQEKANLDDIAGLFK